MQANGVEVLLVAAVAAAWVAAKLAERFRRARVDLRDAVQRVAEIRASIPMLAARAVIAAVVLAALLVAAGRQ